MATFADRLMEEKTQLLEKHEKLKMFIASKQPDNVTDLQWDLLHVQYHIMSSYVNILQMRLTATLK